MTGECKERVRLKYDEVEGMGEDWNNYKEAGICDSSRTKCLTEHGERWKLKIPV